jgi:putative spermidine/putrescine transport system permease protein
MDRMSWQFSIVLLLGWTLIAFLVLPMLVVVPVSLTDQTYLSFPRDAISFQHYANLATNPAWRDAIFQSLGVSLVSAALSSLFGTLCAIGCWRIANRFGEAVRMLVLTPIIMPSIVMALAFYRTWIDLGLIDTFTGVILTHTILGIPYVVIAVSAALANLDPILENAARSLGATGSQALRLVIVPNILPGILSGALFAFVVSWDEVVILLFITARRVLLLPRSIWSGINEDLDPTVAAVATVMIAVTIVVLVVPVLIRRLGTSSAASRTERNT